MDETDEERQARYGERKASVEAEDWEGPSFHEAGALLIGARKSGQF